MVVVPVRCDDQRNCLRGVKTDTPQVLNGYGDTIFTDAGIDNHPDVVTDMDHYTFSVARTEQGEFQLIRGRPTAGLGH